IIHDLIMTSKTFPIPQDFVDRWQAWKRIHREKIVDEFPEEDDIVVLDDHPKYRGRIIEDPDGHSIELIVWK
ncbi:hypothetical protein LCGC14_2864270, partial [marine sediment metagenome]